MSERNALTLHARSRAFFLLRRFPVDGPWDELDEALARFAEASGLLYSAVEEYRHRRLRRICDELAEQRAHFVANLAKLKVRTKRRTRKYFQRVRLLEKLLICDRGAK